MPGQTWTTPEQWKWLCALRSAAAENRVKGRYSTWLASVYHDWFIQWPERKRLFGDVAGDLLPEQEAELGKAVAARRLQLATWFNNHKHKTRGNSRIKVPTNASKNGKRFAHPREVWCRTHYDSEKKAVVGNKLATRREEVGRKLTRAETLAVTRGAIDEFFADASEEVKQEITHHIEEERSTAIAAKASLISGEQRTPEQYQHAVDEAPHWIEQALAPISEALGWCLTVIASGPVPEEEGEIRSFAIHLGRNQSGHTFAQANPDFRDHCVRPLVHFAKGVYPPEERAKRVLQKKPPAPQSWAEAVSSTPPLPSNSSSAVSGTSSSVPVTSADLGPSLLANTPTAVPSSSPTPFAAALIQSVDLGGASTRSGITSIPSSSDPAGAARPFDPLGAASPSSSSPAHPTVAQPTFSNTSGFTSEPPIATTPSGFYSGPPLVYGSGVSDPFGLSGDMFGFPPGIPFSFDELSFGAAFPFPGGATDVAGADFEMGLGFPNGNGQMYHRQALELTPPAGVTHDFVPARSAASVALPEGSMGEAPTGWTSAAALPPCSTDTLVARAAPSTVPPALSSATLSSSVISPPMPGFAFPSSVPASSATLAPSAPLPQVAAPPPTPPVTLSTPSEAETAPPTNDEGGRRSVRNRRPPKRADASPEPPSAGTSRATKRQKAANT